MTRYAVAILLAVSAWGGGMPSFEAPYPVDPWPGVPSDPPSTIREYRTVRLLAQPYPMAVARTITAAGKLDIGQWRVVVRNEAPTPQTVTAADIALAFPQISFLDRATLLSVLSRKSGGWKRQAAHYAMLAGLAVPVAGNAVKIGATAAKYIAGSLTLLEILRNDLQAQLPDVGALSVELPASITLKPGEAVILTSWAGHVRGARPYTATMEAR